MPAPLPPPVGERGLPPPRVTFEAQGELPFWVFLLISAAVFAAGVMLGTFIRPEPLIVRTDLEYIEGIESEAPPLGEPDAGAAAPEQPTPPEPEPPPPQEPEPVPVSEPEPPPPEPEPELKPDFPEQKKEVPTPLPPAPNPKRPYKPSLASSSPVVPKKNTGVERSGGENAAANAKAGPRGVPAGVPNGKGGQKGGFLSRPHMPIDNMIITRKWFGRGTASVTCADGRITGVEITSSTGFPYCDKRAQAWILAQWKCAPGTTGRFNVPIVVKPN